MRLICSSCSFYAVWQNQYVLKISIKRVIFSTKTTSHWPLFAPVSSNIWWTELSTCSQLSVIFFVLVRRNQLPKLYFIQQVTEPFFVRNSSKLVRLRVYSAYVNKSFSPVSIAFRLVASIKNNALIVRFGHFYFVCCLFYVFVLLCDVKTSLKFPWMFCDSREILYLVCFALIRM